MVEVLVTHRIQGCGAIESRTRADSPQIVIPTTSSLPPCSELPRYGLETAEFVARAVRRPTLTAPARDSVGNLWVGMKKRASTSNQETHKKEEESDVKYRLDF